MWAKLALAPALLLQGRQVRRRALRLPEAAGPRDGVVGTGPARLSVLVLGDSAAAGVGAPTQTQALAEPLARALADELLATVHWQLLATTGHTAADALVALQAALAAGRLAPADVMVTSLGVNDVVGQTRPRDWLATLDALHTLARQRLGVRCTWHSALPPMAEFPLLPQPLRWVLGRDAKRLDAALARHVMHQPDRVHVPLPRPPAGAPVAGWMAEDGFHPGQLGYAQWAQHLAQAIARPDRAGR